MELRRTKKVLLGVSGGIAAYKAPMLVRALVKSGREVRVVMTEAAHRFVAPLALETVSGYRVRTDVFDTSGSVDHVEEARWADVMVVAPATANILAKMAHGLADDMLTTMYLAFSGTVVVAPGMNTRMWEHAATRHNVSLLEGRGVRFVGPDSGELACREVGAGRMVDPEVLVSALDDLEKPNDFNWLHVMITGGPTREYIDPVRFISNPASGKTAIALAVESAHRGADVTLVLGPTNLKVPVHPRIRVRKVTSSADMAREVLNDFMNQDILIMSAAVADWTPLHQQPRKMKKEDMGDRMELRLARTTDILKEAAALRGGRPRPYLVGFAAETASGEDLVRLAEEKLQRKGCDVILANDVTAGGFGQDINRLLLVSRSGVEDLGEHSKTRLAQVILDALRRHMDSSPVDTRQTGS